MKNETRNDEAVSPVIATILMVAITVVLAGVLYVWAANLAESNTDGSLELYTFSGADAPGSDGAVIMTMDTGKDLGWASITIKASVDGATSSTYTLVQDDIGAAITVEVSYTDGEGTAESVTSDATTAVTNVSHSPTGGVTITGTPTEDEVLTADTSTLADEDGLGTLSYQWSRDGSPIDGATSDNYTLTQEDVGAAITVEVSYTDGEGTAESVTSSATSPVANVNDDPTGDVTLIAAVTEGEILNANNLLADEDGLGTVSYQWSPDRSEWTSRGPTHLNDDEGQGGLVRVSR